MSIQGGVEFAPQRGAQYGCDVIQIFSKNQRQWAVKPLGDSSIAGYRMGMETHELGPTLIHATYLLNLATPAEEQFEKSVVGLQVELERADQLGIPWVVFHPGSSIKAPTEFGVKRVAEGLNEIFRRYPDGNAMALLETNAGAGNCIGDEFEELEEILALVDDEHKSRVGVCVDTCHIYVAGYPIHTAEGYDETWDRFGETVGFEHLKAFHLNDCKAAFNSKKDRHENIGKGTMGPLVWERLMNDARFKDLPGYLETPLAEEGYPDDLAYLRGLVK